MKEQTAARKTKIGLQVKAVLILTFMVLAATTVGGWLYFMVTARILRSNDLHAAESLADGMTGAAAQNMANGDLGAVARLVDGLMEHPQVLDVCIADVNDRTVTAAGQVGADVPIRLLTTKRPALSYERPHGEDYLEIGRPIIRRNAGGGEARLIGGIRLLLDTRDTARILAGVQEEVLLVAALVLSGAIPVGLLLVWRVVCNPIGRLVSATRQLADGDFSIRVNIDSKDEIGELARSFNVMTERLGVSRTQLRQANESLERKVAERTADLETANHRLREEIREKEDFLRAVSHDLSTPLRNIAGMAAMIAVKHRGVLPEEVVTRLERIQANVDVQSELINELLELSRIRTRPERRQRVDFGELLDVLKGTFEYDLKQKKITLTIHGPMPTLRVERNRMRQVFQNLVDNAAKYMHRETGGCIDIRYELIDGMHCFSVSDNGPGIPAEEQDRVFYIFGRGAAETAGRTPGRGVGLALVRSIAHNYDGWAWVESEPGHGATFCVSLDAKATAEKPRKPRSEDIRTREPVAAGDAE